MYLKFNNHEQLLWLAVLALTTLALVLPPLVQPAHQHAFADVRVWAGVPFAADVLSNLPFVVWGVAGLGVLLRWQGAAPPVSASGSAQTALAALFFAGLVFTAPASAFYHWQPLDARLAIDRLGMVVAFAGLIGLAAADRVSARAGICMAACLLVLGPLSVGVWSASGNVMPWLLVQFGGMALVLGLACLKPLPGAPGVAWGAVIAIYALAKLFEMTDEAVYAATSGFVSGHSLKHIVASFAAWPVVTAWVSHGKSKAEFATALHAVHESRAGSRIRGLTASSRATLPQVVETSRRNQSSKQKHQTINEEPA